MGSPAQSNSPARVASGYQADEQGDERGALCALSGTSATASRVAGHRRRAAGQQRGAPG